jgi:hypothetical protein
MAQDEFPIALKRLEEAKDSLRSAAEASLSSHDQFKSAIESSLDLLWPSLSEDSELTEDRAPGSPEHLINTQTRDKLTERLKSLSPIVLELSSLTASLDDLVGQRLSKIESFLLALSRLLIDFTDRPRARAGFNQPRERGYREAGDKSFNYRSNRPKYNESRSTDSRSNQSRSTDSKFNQSRSTDSRSNQSRSTDSRSGGPSRFKPYNRSLSEESKLRETREKRSRPKGSSQGRFEGDRFNGAKKGPGKGKKEAAASKKESALRGPDAEGFKQEEIDKLVDQLLKNKKK